MEPRSRSFSINEDMSKWINDVYCEMIELYTLTNNKALKEYLDKVSKCVNCSKPLNDRCKQIRKLLFSAEIGIILQHESEFKNQMHKYEKVDTVTPNKQYLSFSRNSKWK